jgi:cytochrome c553
MTIGRSDPAGELAGGFSSFWRRQIARACVIGAVASIAGSGAWAADAPSPQAKEKLEACKACHGEKGISENPEVPSLAAQQSLFTQWQLIYMRDETRKIEAMAPLTKDMSDAEVRYFGDYFAALPPPVPAQSPDAALTATATKLISPRHCDSCHKDAMEGQGEIPRLAGQREDYLLKALHDYRSNVRSGRGNAAMPEVATSLSNEDIATLAHYLARLR